MRYHWNRTFEIKYCDSVHIKTKEDYLIKADQPERKNIEIEFKDMFVLEVYERGEIIYFWALSSNLIDNTRQVYRRKNDVMYYYIEVNDKEFARLTECLYVLEDEMPDLLKELYDKSN